MENDSLKLKTFRVTVTSMHTVAALDEDAAAEMMRKCVRDGVVGFDVRVVGKEW
jgi:hypothetical protein